SRFGLRIVYELIGTGNAGHHPRIVIPAKAGIHVPVIIPAKAGIHVHPSFPRKRESMLSVSGCDDSRKCVGSRWIPAFAGMTTRRWISAPAPAPAFAGVTFFRGGDVLSRG